MRRVGAVAIVLAASGAAAGESVRVRHERWAQHFLLPGARQTEVTAHFVVTTDSPHDGVAARVAQNLEATFAVISWLLAPARKPLAMKRPVAVYAYRGSGSFEGFARQVGAPESAMGIYVSSGVLAFALDAGSAEAIVQTMVHEATHAYLGEVAPHGDVAIPKWLGEGFATYVGSSELRRGELILGSREGATTYHGKGWTSRGRSSAKVNARLVRSAMKKESAFTTGELMRSTADSFYGDEIELFYAEAWLLVHFLIHGQAGWDTQRFPALVQRVVEGQPAADAVRVVYGLEGEALDRAYFAYVRSF